MKTKLTSVAYLGTTAMDRLSKAMLPWILKEIKASGVNEKLSIAIEDGCLKAYNANFEPVIVHRLVDIIRASQVPGRADELFYILHDEKEGLLKCYLFRATSNEVSELFTQMREPSPTSPSGSAQSLSGTGVVGAVTRNVGFQQSQQSGEHLPWSAPAQPHNCNTNLATEAQSGLVRSISNASALTSLCADLSPSDSHFFEVLYIGKVRISSQRKVPETLIDDALNKFAQHEAEKAIISRRHSLLSSTGTSVHSNDSTENVDKKSDSSDKSNKVSLIPSTTPLEPDKQHVWKSTENINKIKDNIDKEFDMFSKERMDNTPVKKNNQIPLEPRVLIVNKNNLHTVSEDEEKHEEIHSKISETASSITQFCQNNFLHKKHDEEPTKEPKNTSPDSKDLDMTSKDVDIKRNVSNSNDPLMNAPVNSEIEIKPGPKLKFAPKEESNKRQDSPAPLNFDEITRTPKTIMTKALEIERRNVPTMPENKPFLRDRSASIGTLNLKTPIAQLIGEQNRTMLFQVGRSELRLISPDRKQILLHRAFKDVALCVLGRSNKEHFGFVCRENAGEACACYVFKCESDEVAVEVVNAIKQAFIAHADLLKKSREKSPNMTCEHCPVLWYHRLCHDIEGMNEKKTHALILRRIEQLTEDEQELIITKYQGGTNHMYEVSEHNSFLMMLLRAHCEGKQLRHVHDTAENRSEFLNQYLGGSTIFMKAKRSLSSGFDHLLKRRSSRDDGHVSPQIKKELTPFSAAALESCSDVSAPELLSPEARSKSVSPAAYGNATAEEEDEEETSTPVNSPMMDIFLKVSDNRPTHHELGTEPDATWRQAIYEKVIQPPDSQGEVELTPKVLLGIPTSPPGKRSKDQLRQLWKMAIDQTILLVRMEKENLRLKESEESSAVRRIKLEYAELGASDAGVTSMWDSLLSRDASQPMAKVDRHMLTQAVIQGVPRVSRGAVWYFLAEQQCLRSAPPDARCFPHYHHSYRTLLAGLTKHQHAILIDLGRTFPKHSYFASALGPGQLALYNILKAYSLLDPDVGYCQGLSFVAGVLLLHMDEAEAFILLRHLMFRRGLRKQYLPDMSALQVQLFQLSRLVRDHEPELHAKLEELDISPALYAAPWMLTLFTSQFPLGFVVRVFDLIFLDSLDVMFSVSLALLSIHKDGLMLCESCEEAAEYLKHKLPDMGRITYEKVMKKVLSLDISRQLSDYAVEYAVLREEMPRMATLADDNRRLLAEKNTMTEQLDSAMDSITNYQKTQARLESQNKTMEQQLTLLSRYISAHNKQDMPIEIKKIIQNYNKKISFSSKILKFTNNDEDDDPKKQFKIGVSTPNLFAKITKEDVMNAVNKERSRVSPESDRKHFLKNKSQSVHGLLLNNLKQVPLKVLEESETEYKSSKSEYGSSEKYKRSESFHTDILTESLKELGRKNTGFFKNTHEQIRQERMFEKQLKHDFDTNLKKLDEQIQPTSLLDDLHSFQSRKCMSLNLNNNKLERKGDSGFVTPMSPSESERKDDNCSIVSHPLSDCDVDIKFDGQLTKLKQIRPVKQNGTVIGFQQT